MEFIFVFTTGRSGTAFLSQAFGHGKYEKNKVHITMNKKALVTHESWKGMPISKLKKEADLSSNKVSIIIDKYLKNKIIRVKEEYPESEKYLITDHRVGRFCSPSIAKTNLNYKVIRLARNHEDVANSLVRRVSERKKMYNQTKFLRFYNGMWQLNLYHPSDNFVINNLDDKEWNNLNDYDKFLWYSKEVEAQWNVAKKCIPKDNYIEITFNDILTSAGLNKINNFTGLKWSKHWATIKANE